MIHINLVPPSEKKQRKVPSLAGAAGINLGLVFGALFVVLVGALGVYWWTLSSDIASLERQIADNEREKTRLQAVIAEGKRFKQDVDELERRVNAIEAVARNQARPAYLMDAMADMLPSDLWLTRVEEKGHHLRLAGSTHSSAALSDFMSNLKTSGKFKDVDLVESRQDLAKSPRTISFEVSCRFEI
jgi:type IV pilus assembly protein PilN